MKNLLYGGLAIALLIAGCKDRSKDETATTPTTTTTPNEVEEVENVDTVLSAETIQSFSTNGFTDFVKKQSPSFDWNKFRMTATWVDSTPVVMPFNPDKDFYRSYGPFLKYSPDSSLFIDLDSYNIDISKDSKGNFTGRELGPDTEISLVDIRGRKKTRLLFMGPGGSVEDGAWVNNNTLVLMGVQDNGEEIRSAALWRYDVPTHTFFVYESPDTALAAKLIGYWKSERLKKVKIQ